MFGTRLVSGIVLIIIALLSMGLGGPALAAVLLTISLIAYRELTKVLQVADKEKGLNLLEIAGMAGVMIYYAIIYFSGSGNASAYVHRRGIYGSHVCLCCSVSKI